MNTTQYAAVIAAELTQTLARVSPESGEQLTDMILSAKKILVTSGSGTTGSLVSMTRKAKQIGAAIATVTIRPQGAIGQLADLVVEIPAPTPKAEVGYTSIQPMGSLFEQSCLLYLDAVILRLMEKKILADTKIMDAGALEATSAFEAGADYVTFLAVTDLATVEDCLKAGRTYGKKVVADLICVQDIPAKVAELEAMGVDGIAVHTGVDQQKRGRTPLDDLKLVKECAKRAEVFVAGGISLATVPAYAALAPDVLIVGGAIGNAADPAREARLIFEKINS